MALIAAPVFAQPAPISVGVSLPQTGALASLADDYRKALLLWLDEANAAGGLLGRRLELRLHDDGSDAVLAGKLYAQLIKEKTDLLIGPYGSAATLMAGAEAERSRRVLINGAGASRTVHARAPRYVFQTTIPYASHGVGALELSRGQPGVNILARDDQAVSEMAEATRERALKLGFKAPEIQIYRGGADDFEPQIGKTTAGAWIAFSELRDTADMLRTFRRLGYAPPLFFARGAADPRLIKLVGQDAEFALGTKEYDPAFRTPGNERFAPAFASRWGTPPGLAAAQGYAAATVLAEAVRRAGTLDQAKLRAMLAQMETGTVLGGYKVDPDTGEQTAARPAVVQIQRGKPQVVWPPALATSTLQPYPQWGERQILKE
jgi:branched-chain amino acid transport system substrate-binding protein